MPFDTPVTAADATAQTSKFFRGLASDKNLDPRAKAKMATQFFSDVNQIRKIRQQNELYPLRLAQERTQLEAARFTLDQARKRAQQEEQTGMFAAEVDNEISGILDDPDLTPDDRVSAIRRSGYNAVSRLPGRSPDSSWIARKYAMAERAATPLTKAPTLLPSQIIRAAQAGVPVEVLDSGDPVAIGQAMEGVRVRQEQDEALAKQQAAAAKDYDQALRGVSDIEFADSMNFDPQGNPIPDTTKFRKGDITKIKIKKALSQAPDPELRKAAQSDDPKVLREAFMRAAAGPATPTRTALPTRP